MNICNQEAAGCDEPLAHAVGAAVDNIAAVGETDIFPQSLQTRHLLQDRAAAVRQVLRLHHEFDHLAASSPPQVMRSLVPAGHFGMRLGSRIAPVWNAYYLSLVIDSAPAIERIRASHEKVHSYRFIQPDRDALIFDKHVGWLGFNEAVRSACSAYPYVLTTDISDFYHRIRIDRISNAMRSTGVASARIERLTRVLELLGVDRFGLPVGGPASRILAELALTPVDDRLAAAGIAHVRFVDDIRIFADTEQQAHLHLLELSRFLWDEGLSLQKGKTSVLRTRDLLDELDLARSSALAPFEGSKAQDLAAHSGLPLDPYAELRVHTDPQLAKFATSPDARLALQHEFSKSTLNLSLARNLLAALSFVQAADLADRLFDLLDRSERPALIPILSRVYESIDANLVRLTPAAVEGLRDRLEALVQDNRLPVRFDLHLALVLRLLARLPCSTNPVFLNRLPLLYRERASSLVRCEIITLWAAWGLTDDIQSLGRAAYPMGSWEQATLAIATTGPAVNGHPANPIRVS